MPVVLASTDSTGCSMRNVYPSIVTFAATRTSGGGNGRITSPGEMGGLATAGTLTVKRELLPPSFVSPSFAVQPCGRRRLDESSVHFPGTAGFDRKFTSTA